MLKVLDFYTLGKFSINKLKGVTMLPVSIVVLYKRNNTVREALFNIPKKYNFKYKRNNDYNRDKFDEYMVLTDYIEANKLSIMRRFGFDQRTFAEFMLELELTMAEKYAACGVLKKIFLQVKVLVALAFN